MLTVLLFTTMMMMLLPPSQQNDQCSDAIDQFSIQESVQPYCQAIQHRFINDPTYRINFPQAEVDRICNDVVCVGVLQQLVISCSTFAQKDIFCLDSPAIIELLCSSSSTTNCYSSLVGQGVIGYPQLFKSCLDALYNAESCPDDCRNILMNADCCFVSYYAFMIDTFVDNGGFPIFEVRTLTESVWDWCNLPTIGICPGVNLTDTTMRNNITCDPVATFPPTDSPINMSTNPTVSTNPGNMERNSTRGGALTLTANFSATVVFVLLVACVLWFVM